MAWRGGEASEPLFKGFRLIDKLVHHIADTIQFVLFNFAHMLTQCQIRVAVVVATEIVFQRIVRKAADEITGVRATKTDGIVQRRFMGETVMREAWRNIQNVARFQIFINDWRERIDV